jgi:ubiquitin C-terminal hydrolase
MLTSLFDEIDGAWADDDGGNARTHTFQARARKRTSASRALSPPTLRVPDASTGRLPLAGLANQGATCYLNSLLQAFYTLEPLRAILYLSQLEEHDAVMRVIPWNLGILFSQLDMSHLSHIPTNEFTKNAFDWQGNEGSVQHDAHELVTKLLDLLRNQLVGISIDSKALHDATGMEELQQGE